MTFSFDPISQRYRNKQSGRYISPKTVRSIVDEDISATKARMQTLARDLQNGRLTSDEFQGAMVQEIKELHLANVALARGGADRMNQSAYGRAGRRIRDEYGALQGLMNDIESDPDFIHGVAGRMDFVERVGMYADSAVGTFEAARMAEMKDAGFASMQNVLEPNAHHCEGDNSCPAMDDLGRVAIDDARFLLPGQRACIVKCKCSVRYFKAATV